MAMETENGPAIQMPEPLLETPKGEEMQGNEGIPVMVDNKTLSETIMNDELHPPMLSSVLEMSGVSEQVTLPFEHSIQIETGSPVNSILNEINLGLEVLTDPDEILEVAMIGDFYFPVTGEERD